MNKVLLVAAVATILVAGLAGPTLAGDGNLSKSMLADMGLSGIQIMSDVEGQEIRGKGYAAVYGFGFASVGSRYRTKSYYSVNPTMADRSARVRIRTGDWGKVAAWGSSWSFAK